METKLQTIVKSSGLEGVESKHLLDRFGSYEQIAKEWEVKAKAIVVTDASQVTEMAMAKTARKKFSDLRIEVEKTRKALKEQSLRKGQAIDAVAKFIVSLIAPIEEHLKLQEDFVKIQEAKKAEEERIAKEKAEEEARIELEKKENLFNSRAMELAPYADWINEIPSLRINVDTTEEQYQFILKKCKHLKAEYDKDQEKIRIENEKLRKEAEKKEKKMKAQQEKADAEKRKADEKLRKEQEANKKIQDEIRAKADKERAEADRLAKIEKDKAEKKLADERAKADAERLEKEAIQKKLDAQIECPNCHHKFNI